MEIININHNTIRPFGGIKLLWGEIPLLSIVYATPLP